MLENKSMEEYAYERPFVSEVLNGLGRKKRLLQIITGPRQVGKTTAALQIAAKWNGPVIHASADLPLPPEPEWVLSHWNRAEAEAKRARDENREPLLILDEVQKVKGWSEVVKALWDKSYRDNLPIQVIILGSSSLLIQKGLSESLAGRFFLYRCPHWTFSEMEQAFSWDLEQWVFFGGYPGAAPFIDQEDVWSRYVMDSLVETVLAKDVLQLQTISKPALLRHLFMLSVVHPAQILSYNKMLGQLQDAGNTTTLAHYLKLLETAFLISGLDLFKGGIQRKRGNSPKLIIWNNGLINALTGDSLSTSRSNYSWWGRLVENAVGAHLLNHLGGIPYSVYYWRHKNLEVDFVVKTPKQMWGIEVKSGKPKNPKGIAGFLRMYPDARTLTVGSEDMPVETFFRTDPRDLF
ncbi:MAG: ATP-binding protein [Desulfatiglandaceae bacterium]